jgi:uncharacterized protein (DUF433 family)
MPPDILVTGIYDVATASRLTEMRTGKIRDWLRGRPSEGRKPLWHGQLHDLDGGIRLSFLDLMELVAVSALKKEKIHDKTIRNFIRDLEMEYGDCYALVHQKYNLAGRSIYLHEQKSGSGIINVDTKNYHLDFMNDRPEDEKKKDRIVIEALKKLQFRENDRMVWCAVDNIIVLDPLRGFGQPIIDRNSIATHVIARMAKAYEYNEEAVLSGLSIEHEEYVAALNFEKDTMRKKAA